MFNKVCRPKITVKDTFKLLKISKNHSKRLKKLTTYEILNELVEAEKKYTNKNFFKLPEKTALLDDDKDKEYEFLFNSLKSSIKKEYGEKATYISVVHPEYLYILNCPVCGVQDANTIEHVLPKSKYCQYTITPINLVPMCHCCNEAKHTKNENSNFNKSSFQPYFEDYSRLDGLEFLICSNNHQLVEIVYTEKATEKFKYIMDLYNCKHLLELNANSKLIEIINDARSIRQKNIKKSIKDRFQKELEIAGNDRWKVLLFKQMLVDFEKIYSKMINFSKKI